MSIERVQCKEVDPQDLGQSLYKGTKTKKEKLKYNKLKGPTNKKNPSWGGIFFTNTSPLLLFLKDSTKQKKERTTT
jgi:hypothetical protein